MTFFSLKTPTFRFWHWGSSNIFHPSLCFSSYSKIENNPKGKPEHTLPPAQPLVCTHVRERSTDGFVKGCAGMQGAHPKETSVCEYCFLWNSVFLYLACPYQFQEKSNIGCWCLPTTSKETKIPDILGNTLFSGSCKCLRVKFQNNFIDNKILYSEASREYLLYLGHPLEGVVIMF